MLYGLGTTLPILKLDQKKREQPQDLNKEQFFIAVLSVCELRTPFSGAEERNNGNISLKNVMYCILHIC